MLNEADESFQMFFKLISATVILAIGKTFITKKDNLWENDKYDLS